MAARFFEVQTIVSAPMMFAARACGEHEESHRIQEIMMQEIGQYRQLLGEEVSFQTSMLILRELFSTAQELRRECEGLLARRSELEAALSLAGLLEMLNAHPGGDRFRPALDSAIDAALERLDERIDFWGPFVEEHLPDLDREQIQGLFRRLEELLETTDLSGPDRDFLEELLEHLGWQASLFGGGKKRRRKPGRRKRRRPPRRAAEPSRPKTGQLDLFDSETPEGMP
jgi:hypothetical protein